MLSDLKQRVSQVFSGLNGQAMQFAGRLDDIEILQARLVFSDDSPEASGHLSHLWYELAEYVPDGSAWHGFRVVKLAELRYLPQEARADAALVQKTAAMLRGLYAANIELVVISYGIFDPPLGIVQCYGVAARHPVLETAQQIAESAYATVLGAFTSQFPQSRLQPLSGDRARWLFDALHNMRHVTSIVGSPDPREAARGGQQQQPIFRSQATSEFTQQQNELLFRSMARAGEEFCFLNIATPVSRHDIARMLTALGYLTNPIASRQQGMTSISAGISLPLILSAGQTHMAGQGYGTSDMRGTSDGVGAAHGISHMEGVARSSTWAVTQGQAHTDGHAVTDSVAHTSGVMHATSVVDGQAHTDGSAHSHGVSEVNSHSMGGSTTEATTKNVGIAIPLSVNLGLGDILPIAGKGSAGITPSAGMSWMTSHTGMEATTHGTAVSDVSTTMQSDSTSHATGVTNGSFEATSTGHATTASQADTQSSAATFGGGTSRSQADGVSQSVNVAHSNMQGSGTSIGRTFGAAQALGLASGIAPSVSVSTSFAWKDENAILLTLLLEQQMNLLKEMSEEGGLYSDVYLLTRTENGRRVAEAAAVQAFGGSQNVVTHLQPRRPLSEGETEHLLDHVKSFSPSTLTETLGWINGYAYSSLITLTQEAAYAAPGLFEEGTALTVQERIPPFAFIPDMPGDVVLGHLHSTERGELTRARLALEEARHFHTILASDTRYGKTVAAERLAVEVVNQWHHRTVILDFGAGWRRLINGPIPRERVDLYQLYPGAVRRLRWNFMQIGRRMQPDRQLLATAELLANAGRMGPRQLGFIRRAVRELYEAHGVLTSDPKVLADPSWNTIKDSREIDFINQVRSERSLPPTTQGIGTNLIDLQPFERQVLAVQRSKATDVPKLYEILKGYLKGVKDQASRQSLEGVLLRLEPFTQGELALMYGGGEGSIAIEDLGLLGPEPNPADRWGLCVIEGGAEMDEYSKTVVLSLIACHLYNDSVIRRRETIGGFNRPLDIFWEEANKILNGAVETVGSNDGGSPASMATQLWEAMWRDGGKYLIFLHPIVQTVSQLPPGIMASCNNAFFGQMKNLHDRDQAMGHIARSERGVHDEEYKRFLSRMPQGMLIAKFGLTTDIAGTEPMLAKALRVSAIEPSDNEILQRFEGTRPSERQVF